MGKAEVKLLQSCDISHRGACVRRDRCTGNHVTTTISQPEGLPSVLSNGAPFKCRHTGAPQVKSIVDILILLVDFYCIGGRFLFHWCFVLQ